MAYLKAVPALAVREIHLAGHSVRGMIRVDDHASPVCDDVWSLYRSALEFIGPVPTLIEWDNDLPPLERLVEEAQKAQSILQEVCHADAA
jgi:hypothetical protein